MTGIDALLPEWLQTTADIARQAGHLLQERWFKALNTEDKGCSGDLVTDADRASEGLIKFLLQTHFPTHSILAEESGQTDNSSDFLWVVDPLDGTTNYAHHFPVFAVSIGLVYCGKPILGVVYQPITHELFCAAQGRGATLNGTKISVSHISRLEHSLLSTGFAYDRRENPDNNYKEFCHFTHLTHGVRRLGSAALDLAFVAAGRTEGHWERGLKPWDMAAGVVLVQEAGGHVSGYDLSSFDLGSGTILATNGLLHDSISRELLRVLNN